MAAVTYTMASFKIFGNAGERRDLLGLCTLMCSMLRRFLAVEIIGNGVARDRAVLRLTEDHLRAWRLVDDAHCCSQN